MLKSIFKLLFKLAMLFGLVVVVMAVIQRLEGNSPDYVEIYNDEDDLEGEYY